MLTSAAPKLRHDLFRQIRHIPNQPITYLQNPKVATKSIELSLWRLHDPANLPANPHAVRTGPFIRHARHLTDKDAASLLASQFFSVVRNPYSRFLSAYLNKTRGGPWLKISTRLGMAPDRQPKIHELLAALNNIDPYEADKHFRPQHINLLRGFIPLDFLGHLEALDEVERFLATHGFALQNNRTNATGADSRIKDLLDARAIEMIQEIYDQDFSCYGYSRDPATIMPTHRSSFDTIADKDRSALREFVSRWVDKAS